MLAVNQSVETISPDDTIMIEERKREEGRMKSKRVKRGRGGKREKTGREAEGKGGGGGEKTVGEGSRRSREGKVRGRAREDS